MEMNHKELMLKLLGDESMSHNDENFALAKLVQAAVGFDLPIAMIWAHQVEYNSPPSHPYQ
jgi:hypothetical protein